MTSEDAMVTWEKYKVLLVTSEIVIIVAITNLINFLATIKITVGIILKVAVIWLSIAVMELNGNGMVKHMTSDAALNTWNKLSEPKIRNCNTCKHIKLNDPNTISGRRCVCPARLGIAFDCAMHHQKYWEWDRVNYD